MFDFVLESKAQPLPQQLQAPTGFQSGPLVGAAWWWIPRGLYWLSRGGYAWLGMGLTRAGELGLDPLKHLFRILALERSEVLSTNIFGRIREANGQEEQTITEELNQLWGAAVRGLEVVFDQVEAGGEQWMKAYEQLTQENPSTWYIVEQDEAGLSVRIIRVDLIDP